MALIFESPVLIDAVTREYRKRITQSATFLETVPVRVPEVSAERAPLAMRATDQHGRVHSYREFAGGLVRSLTVQTPDEPMAVNADNVAEAMLALAARARDNSPHAKRFAWPLRSDLRMSTSVTAEAQWHEVVSTNRREARAACVDMWQNGACSVDGEIFVPSRGPCWVFGTTRVMRPKTSPHAPTSGTATARIGLVAERGHLDRGGEGHVFPPRQRLLAEIMLRAAMRGRSLSLPLPHGVTLQHDVVGETLGDVSGPALPPQEGLPVVEIAAAAKAVLASSTYDLGRMPTDLIRLFADTTDAFRSPPDAFALSILEDFHSEVSAWRLSERLRIGRGTVLGPEKAPVDPMEPLLRFLGRRNVEPEAAPVPAAP